MFQEGRIVLRGGAQDGHLLVVSGELGSAYMGLQILEREKLVFKEAPGAQTDVRNKALSAYKDIMNMPV